MKNTYFNKLKRQQSIKATLKVLLLTYTKHEGLFLSFSHNNRNTIKILFFSITYYTKKYYTEIKNFTFMATSKLQALWNHPAGPKTSELFFCYFLYFFPFIKKENSIFCLDFSIFIFFAWIWI